MNRDAIDLSKASVFALSVSELLTFAVLLLYLTVTRRRKQIH